MNNDGVISCYKDVGLVTEVFTRDALEKMEEGTMAVGHCRYATTGTKNRQQRRSRCSSTTSKGAMALCHNGNLINAAGAARAAGAERRDFSCHHQIPR